MSEIEFIRDAMPGSEIRVIPGAGHLTTIDNPDAVTAELAADLDTKPK